MFFRKHFLPWTAANLFECEDAYQIWLQKRHKLFNDVRMICLFLAAAALIVGYVLNDRPLMILTVAPLVLVLQLTMALERTEAALDGQNKTET